MSSKNEHNQSLTEQALSRLKDDIVFAFYPPGTRLNIESLKKSYEMGGTPVRESLNQLVSLGLVVAMPLKGFRVAPVSLEDALDVFNSRNLLELSLIQQAIERGGDAWEAKCIACLHRLKRCLEHPQFKEKPDVKKWLTLNKKFNQAVFGNAVSEWLLRMQQYLYLHAQRYEYLCYSSNRDFINVAYARYKALEGILSACLDRDSKEAMNIHADNLSNLLELISSIFS